MATITIPGFIHAKPAESFTPPARCRDGMEFDFWLYENMNAPHVLVCPYELTFDIPEGWDPRPTHIKQLEEKKADLQREFTEAVMLINQQISRLQAIEFTPAEPPPVPAYATADDDFPF